MVRQCAQQIGCAAAQPAPHMITTLPALSRRRANLGDVGFAGCDFAARLQGRDASGGANRFRGDHVLRQRQMRDARTCISRGNGLMDNGRRLRRR